MPKCRNNNIHTNTAYILLMMIALLISSSTKSAGARWLTRTRNIPARTRFSSGETFLVGGRLVLRGPGGPSSGPSPEAAPRGGTTLELAPSSGIPAPERGIASTSNSENEVSPFVELKNGKFCKVVQQMGSGWWRVETADGKELKVRTKEFKSPPQVSTTKSAMIATGTSGSDSTATSSLIKRGASLVASVIDSVTVRTNAADSRGIGLDIPVIAPPPAHQATNKWIIFSDLHVKDSSMIICEEVMRRVHEEALARKAGIIFLGDFWHVRGALSVELLNRVLRSLEKWTVPVIMIPGNHDQVSLGGTVHALEPLVYAFDSDQVLLINEPSICMGALWIPYRRDSNLMKAILKSSAQRSDISMVFCHADVKGAYMNDGMKCREGIDISYFPDKLPIYSGHFHKPHTMKLGGVSLRYVGSPYQTSLSEAGQSKFLYCMTTEECNSNGQTKWREEERWEIDIGKKFFKAVSLTDAVIDLARAGDRLVLPIRAGEDVLADAIVAALRNRGVEVELRYESNARFRLKGGTSNSTAGSDNKTAAVDSEVDCAQINGDYLEPHTIFHRFMNASRGFASNNSLLHSRLVEEGKLVIDRLLGLAGEGQLKRSFASKGEMRDLVFDKVKLVNFGPYGGKAPVEYPLSSRGLVLIRGKSTDGTGADSNGSGKTTLAMSVMWALTGSMDARLVTDGKALDVAYDTGDSKDRRTAEVTLTGTVNGQSFAVTRKRGKKGELLFHLNGKDLTKQAVKDTQEEMDDKLGIGDGLLQRCCFFGQHSHTMQSLLGLTDTKLKSELGALVDIDLWSSASEDVRAKERRLKARMQEINVELKVRNEEIGRGQTALDQILNVSQSLLLQLSDLRKQASLEIQQNKGNFNIIGDAVTNSNKTSADLAADLDKLRANITSWQLEATQARNRLFESTKNKSAELVAVDKELSHLRETIAPLRSSLTSEQASCGKLETRKNQFRTQSAGLAAQIEALFAKIDGKVNNTSNAAGVAAESTSVSRTIDVEAFRLAHERALSEMAGIEVVLAETLTAIQSLTPALAQSTDASTSVLSAACAHNDSDDKTKCPTCGQGLSTEAKARRLAALRDTLTATQAAKVAQTAQAILAKTRVDAASQARTLQDQYRTVSERSSELSGELQALQTSMASSKAAIDSLNQQLTAAQQRRAGIETRYAAVDDKLEADTQAIEGRVKKAQQVDEPVLRSAVERARQSEKSLLQLETQLNASISLLEERLKTTNETATEKSDALDLLRGVVGTLDRERNTLIEQSDVYSRLSDIFGSRGIQHYVYTEVVKQLESIANAYLSVLADSGIQLSLQDEQGSNNSTIKDEQSDSDKITKAVYVRTADGRQYRERALSQLSGGQWRRVSLALDLGFVEMVRRRGILRSNLMIMDEVLTHLDASGREAVGTVLRAMSLGPRDSDSDSDADTTNSNRLASKPSAFANIQSVSKGIEYDYGPSIGGTETAVSEDNMKDTISDNKDTKRAPFTLSSDVSRMLVSSGSYETIIVILQDVVAMELEEAFDHVDVVVKEADTSTVVVDGVY